MLKITLTQFIEILTRTAINKAKKVRAVKKQFEEPYAPNVDCYKMLRDVLVRASDQEDLKASLKIFSKKTWDASRQSRYPVLIAGYLKWLGRKKIEAQRLVPRAYHRGGATLTVNPELRMTINGCPLIVKLYFKEPVLQRTDAQLVCNVISHVYEEPVTYAVLDVQRGRLHCFEYDALHLGMPMVDAELDYIARMWGDATKAA